MTERTENVLILLAVLVLAPVLALLASSCTPKQGEQAIGILTGLEQGCVTVQRVRDPEGRVADVCVTTADVREAIEALLKARASVERLTGRAGPASSSSTTPGGQP